MDILIKSFNRPYYLDRCIQSIYANVLDSTISIKILDDGTPSKYLEKLVLKFPNIQILKSEFYEEKSSQIEQNDSTSCTKIPIHFWLECVKNASNYFVLLEDDIWFTQKINLAQTCSVLEDKNVVLLKLFWLKNPKLIHAQTIENNKNIIIYKPTLCTKNPFLYRIVFAMKRFNLPKLMRFFGLYSEEKALNYYAMYGVAGVIFRKDYYTSLWKKHQNCVDENLQLKNAVTFWHKNPSVQFARTEEEIARTGFTSSATHKSFETNDFDVFVLNKILNEAWFNDGFDVSRTMPNDFNSSDIVEIISHENHVNCQPKDWEKWVFYFKKQFQEIGCDI